MPPEEEIEVPIVEKVEEPKTDGKAFYIIVIPDVGDTVTHRYESNQVGMYELYDLLKLKSNGLFRGDIVPFVGELVKFSSAVPTFRVDIPDKGVVEMKNDNDFKFESTDFVQEIET